MLKPILFAAATLAASLTASPVFAKPIAPEIRTVAYADLDLSSAAGRAQLNRRVEAAVRELCGEAGPSFDLARRTAVRDCIAETRANVRWPATLAGTR